MKQSKQLILPILGTFLAASAGAASLLQLGDNAQLHFLADLTFTYEDNLLLTSTDQREDAYVTFSPGVELRLAESGSASAVLRYQHEFLAHQDFDEFDDDFSDLEFAASYDSGRVMTSANASYREDYSRGWTLDTIGDIDGNLIKRDVLRLGINSRYELSQLISLGGAISYSETDYKDAGYVGNEEFSVPVTVYYQVRPNVDLTAGIRYRNTDADNGLEFDDWYYYVGVVGELFSPVLTADLTVGWQERELTNTGEDDSSSTYNFSLIYTGNPKVSTYATVSRDYRTSAIDANSYTFTSASLGASYAVSPTVGVNASIAFGTSDYGAFNPDYDREEDITIIRLGASYRPNDYLTFNAFYNYREVDGNFANYDQNEVSVTASLRY